MLARWSCLVCLQCSGGIYVRRRRVGTSRMLARCFSCVLALYSCLVCWRGILVQCVGAVFLFSVLARCSCLIAAFMLEGGAGKHPECWRGILV